MTDDVCEVVITAADPSWLADFTRRLVEDRLAACGQQISAIRSIYRWDGAVQDDPEARVALHTARPWSTASSSEPTPSTLTTCPACWPFRSWAATPPISSGCAQAPASRSARVSRARSLMPSAASACAPPSSRSITQSA
ncbi:MAG TPA: divalent cation tolerance protein CutA [Actinoplanes sp.]